MRRFLVALSLGCLGIFCLSQSDVGAVNLHVGTGRTLLAKSPVSSGPLPLVKCNFAQSSYSNCTLGSTFTLTRASTEAVTDNSGNITYASSGALAIGPAGLQVWESRTNLMKQSTSLTNASWTQNNGTGTGGQTAPDGTTNATLFVPSVTSAVAHNLFTASDPTTTANIYTASYYVKSNGSYNFAYLQITCNAANTAASGFIFNLTTGQITSGGASTGMPTFIWRSVQVYSNGWLRVSATMLCSAGSSKGGMTFGPVPTATVASYSGAGSPAFAGDGTSGAIFFGPQFELGQSPSPYIPTTSAAVTRAADNIQISSTAATDLAAASGSVVFGIANGVTSYAGTIYDSNGTVALGMNGYGNNATTALGAPLASSNAASWDYATANNVGLTWGASGGTVSLNGVSSSDATSRSPGATFDLGSVSGSSAFCNCTIAYMAIYAGSVTAPIGGQTFPANCTTPTTPTAAMAAGYTKLIMCQDLTVSSNVDTVPTSDPGYAFYNNFVGQSFYGQGWFMAPGYISFGVNGVTMQAPQQAQLSTASAAKQSPPSYVGTALPNGFYMEVQMQFDPSLATSGGAWPVMWFADIARLTSTPIQITALEVDCGEFFQGDTTTHFNVYDHNTSPYSGVSLGSTTPDTSFHTYGCMWQPAHLNGGVTGTFTYYVDNVLEKTVTYTSSTLTPSCNVNSCTVSDFMTFDNDKMYGMLQNGAPGWPVTYKDFHVWALPYLLKRDLDPSSNDNTPLGLNAAA